MVNKEAPKQRTPFSLKPKTRMQVAGSDFNSLSQGLFLTLHKSPGDFHKHSESVNIIMMYSLRTVVTWHCFPFSGVIADLQATPSLRRVVLDLEHDKISCLWPMLRVHLSKWMEQIQICCPTLQI